MTSLRLRSPIFEHGIVGCPIRRTNRRPSGGNVKEDIEVAEFRAITSTMLDFKTELNREDWLEVSKKHLGWTTAEGDLHFEMFNSLWRVEVVQNIFDVKDDEKIAKKLRFALFLVVQLYELHRPRRTSSLDNFNAHVTSSSSADKFGFKDSFGEDQESEISDPRQLVLESRRLEWKHRLSFTKRRMTDIISLLVQIAPNQNEEKVSTAVLDSLGFLIAGVDAAGVRATRLSEVLKEIKNKQIEEVSTFLANHLVSDESRNPQWSAFDINRSFLPSTVIRGDGLPTMVRGATANELIVIPPLTTPVVEFKSASIIVACHGAHIICLVPATHVHVLGCLDCTIFLGPAYGTCTIEHCERVRVVGSCGLLRLVNSIDTKLNIWTAKRPILLGDCRGIVVGPMNARYPNVKKHAESVCSVEEVLSNSFQAWRHPVVADSGGVDEEGLEPTVFCLQSLDDFSFEPVAAAFQTDFSLFQSENFSSVPLPSEFAAKMLERKQLVIKSMNLVRDAISIATTTQGISASTAKNEIHAALQVAFKDWLNSSGNMESILQKVVQNGPSTSFSE